jgi:hypothetical protein
MRNFKEMCPKIYEVILDHKQNDRQIDRQTFLHLKLMLLPYKGHLKWTTYIESLLKFYGVFHKNLSSSYKF